MKRYWRNMARITSNNVHDMTDEYSEEPKEIDSMNHKSDIKMDVDDVTQSNMVYPGFGDPTEIEPLTYDYLFNKHKGLQEECFKPDDVSVDEEKKESVHITQ